MSKFLRRLKSQMQHGYCITVEINLDGVAIHQADVEVVEYNRHRATKKALKKVEGLATLRVITSKRLK